VDAGAVPRLSLEDLRDEMDETTGGGIDDTADLCYSELKVGYFRFVGRPFAHTSIVSNTRS
jgi:hypothetical protein